MDTHLEVQTEKRGSSSVVAGHTVFLLRGDWYVGEILELHQGCQGTFRGSRGKAQFPQDAATEKGLLSSSGENLLIFLELQRELWGSSRVMTGTSGTRSCCLVKVKSPHELWGNTWVSSPVGAGAKVLIWS